MATAKSRTGLRGLGAPPHHLRWWIAAGVVAIVVIGLAVTSRVWTEVLWYRSVEASAVYVTRLGAGLGLFAVFGLIMGGAIAGNLVIARRMGASPPPRPVADRPPMGALLTSRAVVIVPAAFIGLLTGLSASAEADTLLAWLKRTPFGVTDPYFGKDIGFFVFSLPWWQFVCAMLMATLVISGLAAAVMHLVDGSLRHAPIRLRMPVGDGAAAPDVEVSNPFGRRAQAHLSVLVGLILVVLGVQSLLGRYAYSFTDNGLFTGIGYTEQHSRIVAKLVLAIIAFICAGVFFANAALRRWAIAVSAIVLMVVSSLVISVAYPLGVQRFVVRPDEPMVQAPYIKNAIAATRAAYGIQDADIADYSAQTQATAGQLKADAEALPGIRLMDPSVVAPTFEQLQQVRGYYSFPTDLDVDRYTIDGTMTDAIVAAREIDRTGMPDHSWNNLHTVFTHGYGLVAAYGNQRQPNGEPNWITGDIPPQGALPQTQARIYFGESTTDYAIVGAAPGATPVELDTPGGGTSSTETRNTYDGTGGVPVGNWWHRLLFALKFQDLNMLLSDRVNPYSKMLYDRLPAQRVSKVAPWLTIDGDPFPAIVDGRLTWIVDCFTTSDRYPESQRVDLSQATSDSTTKPAYSYGASTINYMRNSVKATVDALDGTVTLYAWDASDPILQTWDKVFPGLLQPKSAISADLLAHLRYPQDLFKVQRQILGRYHATDSNTWYQQSDLWQVPDDPRSSGLKEPPYYLSIKWPTDAAPVFSLTSTYVPSSRNNLGGYLAVVADASAPDYGNLRVLRLSDAQQIPGPGQTYNAISTDQTVAAKLFPFTSNGAAKPVYGNLLTLPLGGGLIYVQPIYTQRVVSSGTAGSYPVLRFVAVRFGDQIAIGDTLQQALDTVFQGDAGATTGEQVTPGTTSPPGNATTPPTTSPTTPSTPSPSQTPTTGPSETASPTITAPPESAGPTQSAQEALNAASRAFAAASQALQNGDLAEYQRQIGIAQQQVAAAQSALG
ncbi:MAG: UPF0182 family protein [Actinomycetia bacterium]|nr:UPF0182 family protein [Actinomycetes bacterium]